MYLYGATVWNAFSTITTAVSYVEPAPLPKIPAIGVISIAISYTVTKD